MLRMYSGMSEELLGVNLFSQDTHLLKVLLKVYLAKSSVAVRYY